MFWETLSNKLTLSFLFVQLMSVNKQNYSGSPTLYTTEIRLEGDEAQNKVSAIIKPWIRSRYPSNLNWHRTLVGIEVLRLERKFTCTDTLN